MNFIKYKILTAPIALCPDLYSPDLPAWITIGDKVNPVIKLWLPPNVEEYAIYENSHPSAFKVIYWIYSDEVVAMVRDKQSKTIVLTNKFKSTEEKDQFIFELKQKVENHPKKIRMIISFNTPLSSIESLLFNRGFTKQEFKIGFPNKKFKSDQAVGHTVEIELPNNTNKELIETIKADLNIINDYFSEQDFVKIFERTTFSLIETKEVYKDMKVNGAIFQIVVNFLKQSGKRDLAEALERSAEPIKKT